MNDGGNIAPHVGARIETLQCNVPIITLAIAPHVGARIETTTDGDTRLMEKSSPLT